MKAWLIDSFDGVSGLRLADVPDPRASDGEVVLGVRYAALNPADYYLAQGQYPAKPPLPHVLGRDGLGEVVGVGEAVNRRFKPGSRWLILRGDTGVSRWGTLAGRVAVGADSLAPIPAGWSEEQAAGASLVYLTAYQALGQWGDLLDRSVVLITGASGGVGIAALQLAKAMGQIVVALSRSPQKRRQLEAMGAAVALDPLEPDWPTQMKRRVGRKADLAVSNVGGPLFIAMIEAMGPGGRVSVVGSLGGSVPEFNPSTLLFRRLRIGGVAVGSYSRGEAHEVWSRVVALLDRTGDRPVIDHVYDFADLPAAFERLKQGPMGKVLLRIGV